MQIMRALAVGVSEAQGVLRNLWRIARELWHQIFGLFFFAFALWGMFANSGVVRSIQRLDKDPHAFIQLLASSALVLVMTGFGISSFSRARKVSRER